MATVGGITIKKRYGMGMDAAASDLKEEEEPAFTKTDLRISTMVITAHWGMPIKLDSLFQQLPHIMIPTWYPAEGILKFENRGMVLGSCYKDIFTNRKITSKSFFNQSTMVLRRALADGGWKEVNVKLFANGGIQMTGITSPIFARSAMEWLLNTILTLPESPFEPKEPVVEPKEPVVEPKEPVVEPKEPVVEPKEPVVEPASKPSIQRFSVQLINTDYSLNRYIHQDALHKILINEYNLFSMLEKTIYQGVNTKFFYNTNNHLSGVCQCPKICKGQGTGDGNGQCKRITMSIFRTGRIIITGARQMDQIRIAYDFLNGVFERHAGRVLY